MKKASSHDLADRELPAKKTQVKWVSSQWAHAPCKQPPRSLLKAATPTKHTGLSAAQSLCRKEPGSPDTNNVIRLCPREHHQHTDRTTDSLHSAVSRACDDVVPISTDGHSPDLPRVTHKRGHALKVLDGPAMGIMHSDDYEGVVPICIDGQPPDILYVWGRHGALYTKFSSVT
eukprot:254546-Pelagomonas_calceolata.AAC.4